MFQFLFKFKRGLIANANVTTIITTIAIFALSIFQISFSTNNLYAKETTLKVVLSSTDPTGIQPYSNCFETTSLSIYSQIFDPLIHIDLEGKLAPSLAISWKQLSPTLWEFNLRKGVKFHNGEDFNGESVKFSFESILNPENKSSLPFVFNTIKKVSVDAKDPYKITIETAIPDGMFLYRLAFGAITPPGFIKTNGFDKFREKPIGTGPYKFIKWEKGKEIYLTKNTNYWINGIPKIDHLRFKFIPVEQWIDAFIKKEVDFIPYLEGRFAQTIAKNTNGEARIMKRLSLYSGIMLMRNQGPLAVKEVRVAINHAIDRDKIIRIGSYGNAIPVAGLGIKGELGTNEKLIPYAFDLERAKKLLASTPHKDGFKLKVLAMNTDMGTIKIIAGMLDELKIKMEIDYMSPPEVQAFLLKNNSADKSKFPYDLIYYPMDNPLVDWAFTASWAYMSASPFSLLNDKRFDEKYMWALQADNLEEHEKRLKEVDKFFYDEALSIFTIQRIMTGAVQRNVKIFKYPLNAQMAQEVFSEAEFIK
ncbi:MAG: ABC transporter substrate-binding protein [Oligoflexia bacterium]|nr:ABC transporter substrate-binding protein [Oligoflexia bacterium]